MTARAQQLSTPPPSVRWRALLVLGLLAGLLGMHALAPGGGLEAHSAPRHMTMTAAAHDGCPGGGDCGGGHLGHADQICASAAVSGGPDLPSPVADPVAVPASADAPSSCADTTPDGGRAPPSLAELQLLRI